jgi:hypothetical protein
MRGKKAKAIAKIVERYEPRRNKHAMRHYKLDDKGALRVASGFSLLYRAFKKAYKTMNKQTVDAFMERENAK